MYGYIYITTNLVNNKKYIGKKKSEKFDSSYFGSGVAIKNAIKKYGKSNFIVEMLEECDSKDELNKKEKEYISKYGATISDNFYNIAAGGDGGILWKTPEEHPSLGKQGRVGDENGMYGKSMFEIVGEKRSNEIKGKISSSMSNYYSKNSFVYVKKDGIKKRIQKSDIDIFVSDGWECSSKYHKELIVSSWYFGKPCESCGKPMLEPYGSGKYCSKGCSHKRKRTEEEKRKIRDGRIKHEMSLTEEDKKQRADIANEKRRKTISTMGDSYKESIRAKMRESHLGKQLSDSQKEKISKSMVEWHKQNNNKNNLT